MKCRTALGVLILTLTAGSVAQTQQSTPSTTFTSRSEVVLVPVAVRDKSGQAASGLKKEDFRLSVDGKQVPVASFEEVKSGTRPSLPPVQRDVYTNRIANEDHPQRLTVLLLDYLNTPFLNQEESRREVAKFIDKETKPDEPIALLALTRRGLSVLQTFTTNSGDLSLAIRGSRSEMTRDESNGFYWVGPMPEDASGSFILKDRIRLTLDELEQLGNALSGVPGRKVVVWTTGGFPYLPYDRFASLHQDTEFLDDYQRVWHSLNQANVALYPIDAKGLVNTLFERNFSAANGRAPNPRTALQPRYDTNRQEQDTLKNFADETGGIACVNRNQYESCIEAAQRESLDYYLLSFNVTPEMRNKDWHKIHVKVDGKYEVRTRQGFGVEKYRAPEPKEEMKIMGKALRSPVAYTSLKLSFKWLDTKPVPAGAAPVDGQGLQAKFPPVAVARYRVELPPHTLEIDTTDRNKIGVTIMAVCIKYNEFVCEMAKGIEGHLSEKEFLQSDTIGTAVENEIALPAGHLRVRFAVRDRTTGQIGTVEAPIDVKGQ